MPGPDRPFLGEGLVTNHPKIYAVTDGRTGLELCAAVDLVLRAGVKWIQYRDKTQDQARRERDADMLCRKVHAAGGCFIVNDDCRLTASVGADGVHLGKNDAELAEARRIVGKGKLIGVSCYQDMGRARSAELMGANYVAFGSVFRSPTKEHASQVPVETLRLAARELRVPVCAIGGLNAGNVQQVIGTGVQLIAVVSGVFAASDMRQAAAELVSLCAAEGQEMKRRP